MLGDSIDGLVPDAEILQTCIDFEVGLYVEVNSTKLFLVLKQATRGKLIRENNLATARQGTEVISS